MKGFPLGLALKQRQKATWKSPIVFGCLGEGGLLYMEVRCSAMECQAWDYA